MVNKKYLLIYLFLAIVPIVVLGVIYPSIPEEIVLRNPGTANEGYGSKLNLWLLPIINCVIALLGIWSPTLSKKNLANVGQKTGEKIIVVVMVLLVSVFSMEVLMAKNIMTVGTFGIVLFVLLMPIIVISIIGAIQSRN